MFGREHRSRTLLNLLGSFFHSPTSSKCSSSTLSFPSCFHFALVFFFFDIFLINYLKTRCHCNTEKQLLDTISCSKATWGRIREWVILPSSQAELRKSYFIDQSAFSNFALHVISKWIASFVICLILQRILLQDFIRGPVICNGFLSYQAIKKKAFRVSKPDCLMLVPYKKLGMGAVSLSSPSVQQ